MVVDFILLGIIILGALLGLCKGFIKSVVSFFKGATGLIIATFLSKPVASILTGFKLNEILTNAVAKFNLLQTAITEEAFNTLLSGEATVAGNVISENMQGKVAILIKAFFGKLFTNDVAYTSYADLTSKFNIACSTAILIVISFFIVLLLLNIILSVLYKIFTNSANEARFGIMDRLLGMIFGILKAGIVIVVIMFAVNISSLIPVVGTALTDFMADSKVAILVYDKLTPIFNNIVTSIDFNGLVKTILPN